MKKFVLFSDFPPNHLEDKRKEFEDFLKDPAKLVFAFSDHIRLEIHDTDGDEMTLVKRDAQIEQTVASTEEPQESKLPKGFRQ